MLSGQGLFVPEQACKAVRWEAQTVPLPLCGQCCQFSPFRPDLLAVGTAELFGITGPGGLHVFLFAEAVSAEEHRSEETLRGRGGTTSLANNADSWRGCSVREIAFFRTADAVTDCAWSETNENTIATAGADGVVRLWDIRNRVSSGPSKEDSSTSVELKGHAAEVSCIEWPSVSRHLLLSASWDGSARVWHIPALKCTQVLPHPQCVYAASFSPHRPDLVGSVSADGRLRLFDLNAGVARPGGSPGQLEALAGGIRRHRLAGEVVAHAAEALSLDWSKYQDTQIFTGGSDGTLSAWDIRLLGRGPLLSFQAHGLAVRALRCSPFSSGIIATASYDTSVKVFSIGAEGPSPQKFEQRVEAGKAVPVTKRQPAGLVLSGEKVFDHHIEFVVGIDWSLFHEHLLASASWDRHVCLWSPLVAGAGSQPPPRIVPRQLARSTPGARGRIQAPSG
ncbi:wd g-beta repeat-containing protein [Cystoisospora suis]|uniref:Peroxin-7 n=1 Tax=Cystoisospora suis TaxID=483139 RepID=A0A2C6KS69_9APIC|nr:wd g-beta repeat-containing protein [Cystoisospora suis]